MYDMLCENDEDYKVVIIYDNCLQPLRTANTFRGLFVKIYVEMKNATSEKGYGGE